MMLQLVLPLLIVSAQPVLRPTVAILPPVAKKGADAWIGLALADNLNTRLLVHRKFDPKTLRRTYPLNVLSWRQTLAAARAEGIRTDRPPNAARLVELKRQLGADFVFAGNYTQDGGKARLTWRLYDGKGAKSHRSEIALPDMARSNEELTIQVLTSLGQQTKTYSGHRLKNLPVAAMRPYGQALAITGGQSLDPRAHLVLPLDDIQRAHALLSSVTDAAPEFSRAWVERSVVSTMMGEHTLAEQELIQAMAQAGDFDPPSALGMYYLYAHQDKLHEAIDVLEEATKTHPGFLHGLGYLGQAYARATESHHALKVFTEFRARVPASPWARVMRAQALSRIGKHELAVSETMEVIKEFPGSIMVLTGLASRQIDARKYEDARRTLKKALKLHRDHPALLTRLSYVELETGKSDIALRLAKKAVSKIGDGRGETLAGYAHLNLGHALALNGKNTEAYAALKRALELGISAEDRLMIKRDPRLKKFLNDVRSPLKPMQAHRH